MRGAYSPGRRGTACVREEQMGMATLADVRE